MDLQRCAANMDLEEHEHHLDCVLLHILWRNPFRVCSVRTCFAYLETLANAKTADPYFLKENFSGAIYLCVQGINQAFK